MSTKDPRVELLQGTLELLVLRTLLPGRAHGHAIAKSIERSSSDVLQVEQGSLYPALHRLIKRGWIVAEDGTSENNRRAKFYRLTPKGKRQLTVETGKWERLASAIARILRPETEPTGCPLDVPTSTISIARSAITSKRKRTTTSLGG